MIPQTSPDAMPVALGADFNVQHVLPAHPLSGNRPALVIENRHWPGEMITLWYPEELLDTSTAAKARFFRYQAHVMEYEPAWSLIREEDTLLLEYEAPRYRVEARLQAAPGRLDLAVTVINRSTAMTPAAWLEICLRTAHAPSFADGTGERTFIHVDGKWLPIARTSMAGKTDSNFSIFPVGDLKQWPWRHPRFHEEPDCPLVQMADEAGRRVLGMANLPQGIIFTNVAGHMRCMHSDAWVPPIEPGKRFTTRGAVFFTDGGIADAEQAYRQWAVEIPRVHSNPGPS